MRVFKNKAERNKGVTTLAMRVFKDKQLLNERPSEMDRETYHFLRKTQTLILQQIFRKAPLPRLIGIIPKKHY